MGCLPAAGGGRQADRAGPGPVGRGAVGHRPVGGGRDRRPRPHPPAGGARRLPAPRPRIARRARTRTVRRAVVG
nr:hypothetical protein [Azospirillum palustre]